MLPDTINLVPRIGVSGLSSPLEVGADRAPEAAAALANLLAGAGCQVVALDPIGNPDQATAAGIKLAESHVDAVAFASVSWFEDYLALDLLEECPVPMLLWSLPGMETGALCGSQQLTCFLKQLAHPYDCVFSPVEPGAGLDKALTFFHAAALKTRLRRARVGFAGYRVNGMTETSPNEFALKKTLGPRLVPLDVPALLARSQEISADQASPIWSQWHRRAGECRIAEKDGLDAARVYLAIRECVDTHRLNALAVGCYPHLMGRVCLAASMLADQGIPLGCEGDVHGAICQLILTLLTNQPTHNTDWLEPLADGTVILTHCGSGSFTLAEDPKDVVLASVRLMGQGVCALFPAKAGPVTLLNLVPTIGGYQCALLQGEALPTEMVFPGNPLRVLFSHPTPRLIDWIHDHGIGHHWMAGYGHVAPELRAWAKLLGPNFHLLTP